MAGKDSKLWNLNEVSFEELVQIQGIGEKSARIILDKREELGGFRNVEDVRSIELGRFKQDMVFNRFTLDGETPIYGDDQEIGFGFSETGNHGEGLSNQGGVSSSEALTSVLKEICERLGRLESTQTSNQGNHAIPHKTNSISQVNNYENAKTEVRVPVPVFNTAASAEQQGHLDMCRSSSFLRPHGSRRLDSQSGRRSPGNGNLGTPPYDPAFRVGGPLQPGRNAGSLFSEPPQSQEPFFQPQFGGINYPPPPITFPPYPAPQLGNPPYFQNFAQLPVQTQPQNQIGAPKTKRRFVSEESDLEDMASHNSRVPSASYSNRNRGHDTPRGRMANLKVPKYNGMKDWNNFIHTFENVAKSYGWSEADRLQMLMGSFEDCAIDFISLQSDEIVSSYERVKLAMADSFGCSEPPQSIRRQLAGSTQEVKESLDEFARRVLKLSVRGYPKADGEMIQTLAVDTFLAHCRDKTAALSVMNRYPKRLSEAVAYMKEAISNFSAVNVIAKQVRQVSFTESSEPEDCPRVYQISQRVAPRGYMPSGRPLGRSPPPYGSKNRSRSRKLQALLDLLGSSSDEESFGIRDKSPGSRVVCFLCNRPGHYQNDCPERKNRVSRSDSRDRSPGSRVVCFLCNRQGHYQNDCPERKNKVSRSDSRDRSPGSGVVCYLCNRPGHYKNDCPERKNRVSFSDSRDRSQSPRPRSFSPSVTGDSKYRQGSALPLNGQ